MLRVRPPERQSVAQAGEAAGAAPGAGDGVKGVGVAVAEIEQLFVAKSGEAVGPDALEVGGGDAAALVADADRDARERFAGRRESLLRRHGNGVGMMDGSARRGGGDGDFDRFALLAVFDRGSEGVLEEFGEDVFEVGGHVGEARVGLAVDDDGGPDAVLELADLRDEGFALADDVSGAEGGVDDADGGG